MNNKAIVWVLYAVVIIALAYLLFVTKGFGIWKNAGTGLNSKQYQAVFLTNGQVYFGKLSLNSAKEATMSDIYYLQVQQVQPKPEDQSQSKLTLIKLGNEIHGPDDKMNINMDQILFWENLKDEGKVVQAIKKYQSEGPSKESTDKTEVQTKQ